MKATTASSPNIALPANASRGANPLRLLAINTQLQEALIAGALSGEPVRGLTHGYYKYPARFSPSFARAAIETFTARGDLVLDNHVGGGTSLVEAMALGRDAIGVDISTLATFIASTKTTVFSSAELDRLAKWCGSVANAVHVRRSSVYFREYDALGYYKHLSHPTRWRLRKAIEQTLGSAMKLNSARLEAFARCVVLRTAQWALDGRKNLPSLDEFRARLTENAQQMVSGAREFAAVVESYSAPPSVCVLNRSSAGLEEDEALRSIRPPRLVLTSPPYPGVHVLYHRWQVDGRKEAPLPFMIANKLDGAGGSYYTMGDRKHPELPVYFDNIRASMTSIAAISDNDTTIVQMVAFSEPKWQLPRYLETMQEAGLQEYTLPCLKDKNDGRLWRSVPGRRWYADQRGETQGSKEVVLIHRRAQNLLARPAVTLPLTISSEAFGEA